MELLELVFVWLLDEPKVGLILLIVLIVLAALVVAGMSVHGMTVAIKSIKGKK